MFLNSWLPASAFQKLSLHFAGMSVRPLHYVCKHNLISIFYKLVLSAFITDITFRRGATTAIKSRIFSYYL